MELNFCIKKYFDSINGNGNCVVLIFYPVFKKIVEIQRRNDRLLKFVTRIQLKLKYNEYFNSLYK